MNRLEELRKEKRLTQENVAEILEVTVKTYRTWCKEIARPDANSLIQLGKLYNCSIDYLLGISDYRKRENEDIGKELHLTDDAIELLRSAKYETEISLVNANIYNFYLIHNVVDTYFSNLGKMVRIGNKDMTEKETSHFKEYVTNKMLQDFLGALVTDKEVFNSYMRNQALKDEETIFSIMKNLERTEEEKKKREEHYNEIMEEINKTDYYEKYMKDIKK